MLKLKSAKLIKQLSNKMENLSFKGSENGLHRPKNLKENYHEENNEFM